MNAKMFRSLVHHCVKDFKKKTPYRTGNLRENAVQFDIKKGTLFGARIAHIYIEDEIAPYVYYTNEPWISPKWHGKKNPNEGWVEKAVVELVNNIAIDTGGKAKEE